MGEKAIDRDKRKALEAVARAVSVEEFYPLMDFVMGSAGAGYRRERNQSREERKAAEVKERYKSLTMFHVQYVLRCMSETAVKIRKSWQWTCAGCASQPE